VDKDNISNRTITKENNRSTSDYHNKQITLPPPSTTTTTFARWLGSVHFVINKGIIVFVLSGGTE